MYLYFSSPTSCGISMSPIRIVHPSTSLSVPSASQSCRPLPLSPTEGVCFAPATPSRPAQDPSVFRPDRIILKTHFIEWHCSHRVRAVSDQSTQDRPIPSPVPRGQHPHQVPCHVNIRLFPRRSYPRQQFSQCGHVRSVRAVDLRGLSVDFFLHFLPTARHVSLFRRGPQFGVL